MVGNGRAKPPSCNTGVKSLQGGAFDDGAFVDWCRLTFSDRLALPSLVSAIEASLQHPAVIRERDRGIFGFAESCEVWSDGARVALVAWGGEAQRGRAMLDMPGEGCGRVRDWSPLIALVEQHDARVTRLDVACDFRAPGLVDAALEAFKLGAFNGRGAPPSGRLVDDLGSGAGRTFYVGSRESATFCRVYEKGRQLGDRASDWVRVEVELKPRGTEIPLGAIVDAAEMFAGAYKFTRALLPVAEEKPVRIARASRVVVGRAIEVAAQQAGAVVGWLGRVGGYSASTIVALLMREPSQRLVGGVLDPGAHRPAVLLRWVDLDDGDSEGALCAA